MKASRTIRLLALGLLLFPLNASAQKNIAFPIACTAEAKLCPDGSSVGREGPNCEFRPCPGDPVTKNPDAPTCNMAPVTCADGTVVQCKPCPPVSNGAPESGAGSGGMPGSVEGSPGQPPQQQ